MFAVSNADVCILYSHFTGPAANDGRKSLRAIITTAIMAFWALWLGIFLLYRMLKYGNDWRLTKARESCPKHLNLWILQAFYVFIAGLPIYVVQVEIAKEDPPLSAVDFVGLAFWMIGLTIEIISDLQKVGFKGRKEPAKPFIDRGLWYYSRHPNYFGEFLLWLGMSLISVPILNGTQLGIILCPFLVLTLFLAVSIPVLETEADLRFAKVAEYQEYKNTTSAFLLLPKQKETSETEVLV